ncbi:GNAT family N-acetyltransferase [Reichenbachiella versicolor]|uniref:hypothetical protein n=1 Tax=Reichenbachiella versicolor TaxID=1821036 RepID=UPI000D6E38ED|nr:hypothetical protein [Reichenbachiella versicolor]
MNQELVEDIVNFDKVQMNGILDDYDPDRRRKGLTREINEGAEIITCRNLKGALTAYIEFLPKGQEVLYVPSLQVSTPFLSRVWMTKIKAYLESHRYRILSSSVHGNNDRSISFHHKLGFKIVESGSKILFEIRVLDLLNKIEILTNKV